MGVRASADGAYGKRRGKPWRAGTSSRARGGSGSGYLDEGFSIQIDQGDWDYLIEILNKEAPSIAQKAFGRAIAKGAARIKQAVLALVPIKEGRLKDSIKIRNTTKYQPYFWKTEVYSKRGSGRDDPKGAFYAHMVEYGTIKQGAQSFIRAGLAEADAEVRTYFISDVKAALAQIKQKMARR